MTQTTRSNDMHPQTALLLQARTEHASSATACAGTVTACTSICTRTHRHRRHTAAPDKSVAQAVWRREAALPGTQTGGDHPVCHYDGSQSPGRRLPLHAAYTDSSRVQGECMKCEGRVLGASAYCLTLQCEQAVTHRKIMDSGQRMNTTNLLQWDEHED